MARMNASAILVRFALCGCALALQPLAGAADAQPRSAEAAAPSAQSLVAAVIAGDRGRFEQIASQLRSAPKRIRGDRRRARDLNEYGLALWQRQRYFEAAGYFGQAREADSADAEIAENLGYALLKSGRIAEAETAIMDALAMAPERASAWGSLGMIYAKQGRHREGVSCVLTAYRYTRDRKRTLDVYTRLAGSDEDPKVRAMLNEVLTKLAGT
jgi:tetratricopeptide (TPR) repeat protein